MSCRYFGLRAVFVNEGRGREQKDDQLLQLVKTF